VNFQAGMQQPGILQQQPAEPDSLPCRSVT
jgi:hypothetical protein